MDILLFLSGFIIGLIVLLIIIMPRLKKISSYNTDIEDANHRLEEQNQFLDVYNANLQSQRDQLIKELDKLVIKKDGLITNISDLETQAKNSADVFYKQTMEVANLNIEKSMEELGKKYIAAQEEFEKTYLELMNEAAATVAATIQEKELALDKINKHLQELRSAEQSAILASKRAEERRAQTDFYKLQLTEIDLQEIEMLKKIIPYLRNQEPLNKVIWKCYYEKPTSDLIGRIIGSKKITGIYKITNLHNEMCYVGQAVDVADRWKQHIKRGLGAEVPTRNKLYPAMASFGVENFSFELIEECSREKLDEREDYWQEYFGAKEFGYSIK